MNHIKHKRGDVREDGLIFWRNRVKEGPLWLTKEKYQQYAQKYKNDWAKYYASNRQDICLSARNYRNENLESRVAYERQYNAANRHKRAAYSRQYYNEHRLECCARSAKWRKLNPDLARSQQREAKVVRRHRERISKPTGYNSSWVYQLRVAVRRLTKCTGIRWSLDHVVPISKGGLHWHGNMQLLPHVLNARKQAKTNFPLPDCYRNP